MIKKKAKIFLVSSLVIILLIGGFMFLKHKQSEEFYSTYNLMNEDYKTVLFATGQNKSTSSELIINYEKSWSDFYSNYLKTSIQPYGLDDQWATSLNDINKNLLDAKELIRINKLHDAHLKLEGIRAIWQDVFERNNVSMLGFYMTQFHDIMEQAVDSSQTADFEKLDVICKQLDEAWIKVENLNADVKDHDDYANKILIERNDVKVFCENVAQRDSKNLNDLSDKLKKDFISVYLKYG